MFYQILMIIPEIEYQTFVLGNGLRVVVHEDHKAPVVAVNVWYHVGSKNEPAGKSGFAHLFEHLMFNGSEHFNDDYFQAMERVGATELNGTTNQDRTNYFQTVPRNALELTLWMESDRMGHLLGAIDQAKLDEQRDVVKNEKRQGQNQPYGRIQDHIVNATYPKGHPYDHTVIGSMEDIDAATVEDVHDWFKSYYGPNNAVLALVGNITPPEAQDLVERYFGDIPPGPPVGGFKSWIAPRFGEQREIIQDRVPQGRLTKVWNVPETDSDDHDSLALAGFILSIGVTSRLHKQLVYKDQIAIHASADVRSGEIGSQFIIDGLVYPGGDLKKLESGIDNVLQQFLSEGPTEHELRRTIAGLEVSAVRGTEKIGGFGGKSSILASGMMYHNNPGAYKRLLEHHGNATPESIRAAAARWLQHGAYVLETHPYGSPKSTTTGVSRDRLPEISTPPDVRFPDVKRGSLSNGIPILFVERNTVPMVDTTLHLDIGYAADHNGTLGTASLAGNLLKKGTKRLNSMEINDHTMLLGASVGVAITVDGHIIDLHSVTDRLEESLDIFTEILFQPSFPENEFALAKQQQLAYIQNEKSTPKGMVMRVFPKLLYGEGHAYSIPMSGSGTIDSTLKLTRDGIVSFHNTWFSSSCATLVVVGDTTLDKILPVLESRFSGWQATPVPRKNIAEVSHRNEPSVYLVDRPGSVQSIVIAGHIMPPRNASNHLALVSMNSILGGSFTSRINLNLREDKGWTYGAGSRITTTRGPRPFIVHTSVQADKTIDAMKEIYRELKDIRGERPPTKDEVHKTRQNLTLSLAGEWETMEDVSASLGSIVQNHLPDDYFHTYADRVRDLDVDQVAEAARKWLRPDRLIWVVVGDRKALESDLRAFAGGTISIIDADGNEQE